jgi:hypothetical protein
MQVKHHDFTDEKMIAVYMFITLEHGEVPCVANCNIKLTQAFI